MVYIKSKLHRSLITGEISFTYTTKSSQENPDHMPNNKLSWQKKSQSSGGAIPRPLVWSHMRAERTKATSTPPPGEKRGGRGVDWV